MLHRHLENESYEFRFLSYVLVEIFEHLLRIFVHFYVYFLFLNQFQHFQK